MKRLILYRKVIVLTLAIVLLICGVQGVCYSQKVSETSNSSTSRPSNATEMRRKILPTVVLIKSDLRQGSGVVISTSDPSHDGVSVLTNEHVTRNSDVVEVYFLAYDSDGNEIQEREFYLGAENHSVLVRLGYVTKGRVVAEDKETDVAIIHLRGRPKIVRALLLKDVDIYANMQWGEQVHILGHPADRELLWQWDPGHFQGYDEKSLSLDARPWFGNSGGPVVNKEGILIGLTKSIGADTKAWAVSLGPIVALEGELEGWHIFSVVNNTESIVDYEVKWSESGDWEQHSLDKGMAYPHKKSISAIPEGYPKIQYIPIQQAAQPPVNANGEEPAVSENDKVLENKKYTSGHVLKTKFQSFGSDVEERINPKLDGYNYRFVFNPKSANIELHEPRQTVWIANHTDYKRDYIIKWAGSGLAEKSYTLGPGKSRPHWNTETSTRLSANYPKILVGYRWTNPTDGTKFSGHLEKANLTTETHFFPIVDSKEDEHITDLKSLIMNKNINEGTHFYHFRISPENRSLEIRDGLPTLEVSQKENLTWWKKKSRIFGILIPEWIIWIIDIVALIIIGVFGFGKIFPERHIFSIQNSTETGIDYQIQWTESKDWLQFSLEPDKLLNHWWTGSLKTVPEDYPKIRFNTTTDEKEETTEQILETYTRRLSRIGIKKVSRKKHAREYHFEIDTETNVLNLVDSEKDDE